MAALHGRGRAEGRRKGAWRRGCWIGGWRGGAARALGVQADKEMGLGATQGLPGRSPIPVLFLPTGA